MTPDTCPRCEGPIHTEIWDHHEENEKWMADCSECAKDDRLDCYASGHTRRHAVDMFLEMVYLQMDADKK